MLPLPFRENGKKIIPNACRNLGHSKGHLNSVKKGWLPQQGV